MFVRGLIAIIIIIFVAGVTCDLPFWPKTKWGFIDRDGNMVIPAKFDRIKGVSEGSFAYSYRPQKMFHDGLAAIADGKKWGFVDKTGKVAIEPQYDAVGDFSENLAGVVLNEKCGFIDRSGKLVIPMKFSRLPLDRDFAIFKDGLCPVETDNGGNGYVDKSGNFVGKSDYYCVWPFSEGRGLAFYREAVTEIVDTAGKTIPYPSNCQIDLGEATGYSDGLARVRRIPEDRLRKDFTGHYWFIDRYGHQKTKEFFGIVKNFSEGLAAANLGGDKFGYINHESKMVIEPAFDSAEEFHEGLAAVGINNPKEENKKLYGFIDRNGAWVVKPKYNGVDMFSEGRAAVRLDGSSGSRYGYIDKTGNLVVPLKYSNAYPFSEGLAAVKL